MASAVISRIAPVKRLCLVVLMNLNVTRAVPCVASLGLALVKPGSALISTLSPPLVSLYLRR
jgi:hypothetical protein